MTAKEKHAKAAEMLARAEDLMEQAASLLRSASTIDCVQANIQGRVIGMDSITGAVSQIAKDARHATCDDCGQLIALCNCSWANRERGAL